MRRLGTNWGFGKPKPEWRDGIYFPSQSELKRYLILRLEEKGGLIRDLKIHQKFPLVVEGRKIGARGTIEIDFGYDRLENDTWTPTLEDHKPVMTREARQRLDVFEAISGRKVLISGAKASKPRGRRKSSAPGMPRTVSSTSSARD